jgi:hypothetical protein
MSAQLDLFPPPRPVANVKRDAARAIAALKRKPGIQEARKAKAAFLRALRRQGTYRLHLWRDDALPREMVFRTRGELYGPELQCAYRTWLRDPIANDLERATDAGMVRYRFPMHQGGYRKAAAMWRQLAEEATS